ncbi:hypothetical protein J4E85_004264 [Alternaria conjuncta]|uniref:uncharacterized protein n=1 Tax=Alternaria conjuncta TaxID=181017 RepID=UPI00221F599B|nr:uncharacterized protein J4E85_004264 [Alternaria conjuncta]KAI4931669.1 hypothetical protein J4E85_004264 [Alternaria conjuncta]
MASSKRKSDDGDSDWEGAPGAKQLKTTPESGTAELQKDLGNYGSASSQRPPRVRKPPERYINAPPQPSAHKKKKATSAKANPSTEEGSATARGASHQIQAELPAPSDTIANGIDSSSQLPEKESLIVCLKVPVTTFTRQPSRKYDNESSGSDLSSPPGSLPSTPISAYKNTQTSLPLDGQGQCAQRILDPVPASSQDFATPPASQETLSSQTPISQAWEPNTPEDSMRNVPDFVNHAQTPPSMLSKEADGRFAYLTPESAIHYDLSVVHEKSNAELGNGQVPEQDSYLAQPILPLGSTCGRCGAAGHEKHDCSVALSVPDNRDRSGQVEAWLRAGDAADQSKPPCADLVGPVSSLYAESEATTDCDEFVGSPVGEGFDLADNKHLSDITERLIAQQNRGSNKPEPHGQPEVWADGRQEICETLHYYRAYQSACYSTGGFARGFMFDKVAHARDYMDTNVVISRAGGGLAKDIDSGEMKSKKDQSEDSAALGLRNCMLHYNPVVIITGVDNPNIPSKPPHQYCVLDHFKPTHIWAEKSGNSKIVRYRFEKLNTKKESWWKEKDSQEVAELGSLQPPVEKICGSCNVKSQQIYLNGWMCLQPTCAAFWKILMPTPGPGTSTSAQEPKEASLVYDPRFLKQKTPWHNDDHDYPLVSNAAELSGHSIPGENTSVAFWSGIVCPGCGRCTSRLNWTNWECSNVACQYMRTPPHTLIPALSLHDPLWPVTSSYTLSRDTMTPLLGLKVSFEHGYRINRYELPGVNGFITHMIANKTVLEEKGGPDAMFEELQQTDIGLQRRSMPNGQLKGPNYCRHFAVNYGMPYKFIAATASRSFDGAARPITSTRSRLNWAAKLLLTQETGTSMEEVNQEWQEKEFNEVLALGYFEEQKINYHDDGEFGLGPTIATLSLGAPGTMRIRMKARHYHGVSSVAGLYDDAAPIPGCEHYDARLAVQPSLDALKTSDSKAYNARRKQIPKQLKLSNRGNARDALTMQLGHGDIVIMHGADVQKYYEHAVEHSGKLRFALTCRYIDPKSLKAEDQPQYEVGPDVERYDGSGLM